MQACSVNGQQEAQRERGEKQLMATKKKALKLFPYQKSAVEQMKDMDSVLLTDEMGLGKTVQVLTHLVEEDLFPALICPPKTLTYTWVREIEKWFPELADNITIYDPRDPDAFMEWYTQDLINGTKGIYIMWHDVMSRVYGDVYWAENGTDAERNDCSLDILPKLSWKAVVVDEAHKFRNHNSQRSQGILNFTKGKKILITGTPMVNSAEDLWVLTELMGKHTDLHDFCRQFTYRRRTARGQYANTGFNNRGAFKQLVGNCWIRRTKAQVLKDLPEKQSHIMDVELDPEQREMYDNLVRAMFIEIDGEEILETPEKLSLIMRMRQIAIDPRIIGRSNVPSSKTEGILSIAEECWVNEQKLVVFSNFKSYINILENDLRERGIGCLRITGDESAMQRDRNTELFQTDTENKYTVMLITEAGSHGITLTAASTIIVTDRWWNQPRVDQAIDRIHRIGQENKVIAFYLDAIGTIDTYLKEITLAKDASATALIEAMRADNHQGMMDN